MGKTIWIINQYASNNGDRHADLSEAFAIRGYNVVVFLSSYQRGTNSYLYNSSLYIQDVKGVSYAYLHSGPRHKGNGPKRVLNMLDFCWKFLNFYKKIASEKGKPDYIIASSVHPFVWEVGYIASKKFKSKFIAEIRDLWPLSLIEVQHISPTHPAVKLFALIEKRAYMRADAIVTTMPFAYKYITSKFNINKDRIHWLPNGINIKKLESTHLSTTTLPTDLNSFLENNWCAVYAGSFVDSECVDFIVKSFSKITNKKICLALIGEGHSKALVEGFIKDMHLENIKTFPAVSKQQVQKALSMAKCCVAAVHHYPLYEYGLSMNKLNDYLYSNNPVVFACDYDNVVREAHHIVVPSEDKSAFAKAIENVYEGKVDCHDGRTIIKKIYDYDVIADKYLQLLNSI